jgi:hypothetical protein
MTELLQGSNGMKVSCDILYINHISAELKGEVVAVYVMKAHGDKKCGASHT